MAVSVVGGNTLLTVSGGGIYTLTSATITAHKRNTTSSVSSTPIGFEEQAVAYAAASKDSPVDADRLSLWDSAANFVQKGLTWANLKAALSTAFGLGDGWIPSGETWTYASADAPTYAFTISGDKTSKYSAGMRIKLTDSTVKYFIITKVSYSSPNTTVTVYGGTDYTLSGGVISNPYYSMVKAPAGFPLNPAKWTVTVTDSTVRTQTSPTNNTYYNIGGSYCQLSLPIGAWYLGYVVFLVGGLASGAGFDTMHTALSTASNSATIAAAVRAMQMPTAQLGPQFIPACSGVLYSVTSKTLLYLLGLINSDKACSDLNFHNDWIQMVITAECAYL